MANITEFQQRLENILNATSMENESGTPDFILAQYLTDCLKSWNKAAAARQQWYGGTPLNETVTEPCEHIIDHIACCNDKHDANVLTTSTDDQFVDWSIARNNNPPPCCGGNSCDNPTQ